MKKSIIYLTTLVLSQYTPGNFVNALPNKINTDNMIMETENLEKQNYTASFLVSQSPAEVFKAVNNVRGWWSEQIEGRTDQLNGVFNYHYKDVHICKMKIITLIPGQKVEWLVLDNHLILPGIRQSGRVQRSVSISLRKTVKRSCGLLTLGWCQLTSVTKFAQMPGEITSTAV